MSIGEAKKRPRLIMDRRRVCRGWGYQETSLELYNAGITLTIAAHILGQPGAQGTEPVARVLRELDHLSLHGLALVLVATAIAQVVATRALHTQARRACLAVQCIFFCFVCIVFWRLTPTYIGAYVSLPYTLFTFRRLLQMVGKKE